MIIFVVTKRPYFKLIDYFKTWADKCQIFELWNVLRDGSEYNDNIISYIL